MAVREMMVSQLTEVRWTAQIILFGEEQAVYLRERDGARGWFLELGGDDFARCDADTSTALAAIHHGFQIMIRKTP